MGARQRWFESRRWLRYLHELLQYRARRRFALLLDIRGPAGMTNMGQRITVINPLAVPPPPRPLRRFVRHCPRSRIAFEQTLAVALVEHEAAHVRDSGDKPPHLLGWLWNALEDERIERRDAQASIRYDFLGDVLYQRSPRTHELLAGCLLWRWQWDRADVRPRFVPTDTERLLWEQHIRPRVEAAWQAATSEQVVTLAREILALLGLGDDAPVPHTLPPTLCGCDTHGEPATASRDETAPATPDGDASQTGSAAGEREEAEAPPTPPSDAQFAGHAAGRRSDRVAGLEERDPTALLAHIEGPARALARVLTPPVPRQRTLPHRSRGTVVLDRILAQSSRPLDARMQPAPRRQCALHLLLDVSASMTSVCDGAVPLEGARALALLVYRAAERARQPLAIWAFSDCPEPIVVQPLGAALERTPHRIAGLQALGGTRLGPVFEAAVAELVRRAEVLRLLVVVHDGELERDDANHVRAIAQTLARHRVLLLPLYIGRDTEAVERNRHVFGWVLACEHVHAIAPLVCTWIRASLGSLPQR